MKSYTDLEQSRKLAEILPIESADMWWSYYYDIISDIGEYDKEPMLHKPVCDPDKALPCWSLEALLELLPYPILCRSDVNNFCCKTFKGQIVVSSSGENSIDACVEMIYKLKEKDLI